MDGVAERMLGRLSGRGATGATRHGATGATGATRHGATGLTSAGDSAGESKRSVVERALARTQGILRPAQSAGSEAGKAPRGPALLDRLMERLDEAELTSSPWLDFSVRAPVGTQAYSGDAVVYVDLSEASPVDAFVEDSVDGVGAPRKPKPNKSITHTISN